MQRHSRLRQLFGWAAHCFAILLVIYGVLALYATRTGSTVEGFFAHPQFIPGPAPWFAIVMGAIALTLARATRRGWRGAAIAFSGVLIMTDALRAFVPVLDVEPHLAPGVLEVVVNLTTLAVAIAVDARTAASVRND